LKSPFFNPRQFSTVDVRMAAEKTICAACLDSRKVEIIRWFTTIIPSPGAARLTSCWLRLPSQLCQGGLQDFGGSLDRSVCGSLTRDELGEQILEFRRQWPSDGGKILGTKPLTNCAQ